MQTQKLWIIVDATNAIFEGNTCNEKSQMPKPGVDHQRNPAVYYGKALLRHWVYIWNICQRHPDCDLLLYKDDIKATFRRILCHLDISPAFATVLQHMLCIPVGLIFGADFSPSFFCNTSETRALAATASPLFVLELTLTPTSATALMDFRALTATTSSLFNSATTLAPLTASIRLPYPPSPLEYETMWTHLVPDALHPPLPAVFYNGSQRVTFVDYNMLAATRRHPGRHKRQCTVGVFPLWLPRRRPMPPAPLAEDKYEPFAHHQ
jgi:hypothetical protein